MTYKLNVRDTVSISIFTAVMVEVQLLVIIEWKRWEDLAESFKNRE